MLKKRYLFHPRLWCHSQKCGTEGQASVSKTPKPKAAIGKSKGLSLDMATAEVLRFSNCLTAVLTARLALLRNSGASHRSPLCQIDLET